MYDTSEAENLIYHYIFSFDDGKEKDFLLQFNKKTLNLITQERENYPTWVSLGCNRCSHCSLDEKVYSMCPIAINVLEIIEQFKDYYSYDRVNVTVDCNGRNYFKNLSVQDGLSSLLGLCMVTSDCPVMRKLKPLVLYHLPFSNMNETEFRVISMYLTAQYFIYKEGGEPDLDLKDLVALYKDIRLVNISFSKRLKEIDMKDANVNALVNLDCFATTLTKAMEENRLSDLKHLLISTFGK